MKNWLHNYNSDSVSFSYFRIIFYSILLFYYAYLNLNLFSNWQGMDPGFWEPISFFKALTYQQWACVDSSYLYPLFVASMICCIVGFKFRFFSLISFIVFLYSAGFQCNFGKIHHSNHVPAVILGLLCFVPAGYYSLDRYFSKEGKEINTKPWQWFFFTAIFYMCLVYFNAGYQKLSTSGWEWTSTENIATIILTRPTMTPLGEWIAQSDWLPGLLGKGAVLTELLAPVALFLKTRWRFVYGLALFMLHQGMAMTLGAHGAFAAYQICFLAWVPWKELTQFLCSGNVFKKLVPWNRSSR